METTGLIPSGPAQRQTSPQRAPGALRRRLRPLVTITAPPSGPVFERDVGVRMRDGVVLRVNVFRPDNDLRHPVLLCLHPYGKDRLPGKKRFGRGYRMALQYRLMAQTEPLTQSAWTGWEGPDPAFWVARGYVVVNADQRGWGHSQGVGELCSDSEARDGYDVVEWAAQQPWSTGKVGMTGVSYLAISQWTTASANPPHLAAICPWEGLTDVYQDWARAGGVRDNGFMSFWGFMMRAARRSPCTVDREAKTRPLFDQWWAARNRPLENIDVPALVCGSFSDQGLHSRGSFEGFRRISSPHKWLYTHRSPKWAAYYSTDVLALQEKFFDHFLRGADNGMLDVPRVRVEVREDRDTITSTRGASTWPLPNTQWHILHLDAAEGTLNPTPPAAAATITFDSRKRPATFTYRFDKDTEVVGPMVLTVPVSVVGADDLSLFAGVRKFRGGREVTFQGSFGFTGDLVTRGNLLASHRRVDRDRSLPYQPFLPQTHAEPLTDGQIVQLEVGLMPSATLFRAGEELRVDLQGHWFFPRNPITGQFPAHYVATRRSSCTIHTGDAHQATLTIPTTYPAAS